MKNSDCKLREDIECGEGEVKLSAEFLSADPLYQADVLKDWIYDLEAAYNQALLAMRGYNQTVLPEDALDRIDALFNLANEKPEG